MRRTNGNAGVRSCAIALMVMALGACQSAQERDLAQAREDRQEQTERILERTITVPGQTVKELVEKYVDLPDNLTKPCPVTHNKDRSVGEYVRVANENTQSLTDCAARMEEIRKLQP